MSPKKSKISGPATEHEPIRAQETRFSSNQQVFTHSKKQIMKNIINHEKNRGEI